MPSIVTTVLLLSARGAVVREVGFAPLDVKEVARGYRAEALKLKPVADENQEVLGKVSDFIFSKDGNNIYVFLAVDDFAGPGSHLIAISFHTLKLDDPPGHIVLPGWPTP